MKKYLKYFSIAGAMSLLVICYFQQKQNAKLKIKVNSKQSTIDSLSSEIFVKDIDLGRYEVMWNRITELYPQDVEQIEHEVE